MATDHDTDEDLRRQVLGIVHTLENPPDVDDDGVPVNELGWVWDDESECYRDEDGDECEAHPMSGIDYIFDALDIEYTCSGNREYLGASVLVAFGGPNIRIDTRHRVVRGAWWNHSFSAPYADNIGIDDACEELWEMRK